MSFSSVICDAVLSDVSSDAFRVWMWVRYVEGDRTYRSKVYDRFPKSAVDELLERGLLVVKGERASTEPFPAVKDKEPERPIRRKAGSDPVKPAQRVKRRTRISADTGRERAKEAFANPRRRGAQAEIESAVAWLQRRYNDARARHGFEPRFPAALVKGKEKWRALAKEIIVHDVPVDDFFDFAALVFMKVTRTNGFPTLAFLSGAYIWEAWQEERNEVAPGARSHAGAKYRKETEGRVSVARAVAKAHNLPLTEASLEDLLEQADTLNKFPHLYDADPEYEAAERDLAERLRHGTPGDEL